jgi:crossover junction endodeoxyribonuclease RusA
VTRQITITLPLPPKSLSPNARVHWATKARATKSYRSAAKYRASFEAPSKPWRQVEIHATFVFATNRRRDKDNLLASLKAAFDGLVDAGIVEDDAGVSHAPMTLKTIEESVTLKVRCLDE